MKAMKMGQLVALLVGIASLVILSYNVTVVYAHGGGHSGGGGQGGGGHHGAHGHEHHDGRGEIHDGGGEINDGKEYTHYHHNHDDYGDHYHNCRNIPGGRPQGAGHNILTEQECQNHDGEWEGN